MIKNMYYYFGLAIIGSVMTAITLYLKRKKGSIAAFITFYLFTTCFSYIGEFVVLAVFHSFIYKLGLFNGDGTFQVQKLYCFVFLLT